jgi:hypothetical protein
MTNGTLVAAMGLALALPLAAGGGDAGRKRPHLDLKMRSSAGFAPASITLTAELVGGEDAEEFYCTKVEWDWGDGNRSSDEPDCPPFEPGVVIARRFSARHEFVSPGAYTIRFTMSHAGQRIARAATTFTVYDH